MLRRFRVPGFKAALGAFAAASLLLMSAGACLSQESAKNVLVLINNNWPYPLVVVEAAIADTFPGNRLPSGMNTALSLKANTHYWIFEGANPRYIASKYGVEISADAIMPFATFKTGEETRRVVAVKDSYVTFTNHADAFAAFYPIVGRGEFLPYPIRVEPGQSVSIAEDSGKTYYGRLKDTGALLLCEQRLKLRPGRNYFEFQANVPCPAAHQSKLVLANRRYDRQTYLMAHNAGENVADGWHYAQQTDSIGDLLRTRDVRALELDIQRWSRAESSADIGNGTFRRIKGYSRDFYVCHEDCSVSAGLTVGKDLRTLKQALTEIRGFLDDPTYRRQIVTVFLEYSNPLKEAPATIGSDLMAVLKDADVLRYVFWPDTPAASGAYNSCLRTVRDAHAAWPFPFHDVSHTVSDVTAPRHTWPLVSEMISANRRLVLFVSLGGLNNSACIPYAWNYVRENWYSGVGIDPRFFPPQQRAKEGSYYFDPDDKLIVASATKDFLDQRTESRKSIAATRTLMRFNNFPAISFGSYAKVNSADFILRRILQWKRQFPAGAAPGYGSGLPNFLALDYVEVGGGPDVVEALNACWGGPESGQTSCIEKRLNGLPANARTRSAPPSPPPPALPLRPLE